MRPWRYCRNDTKTKVSEDKSLFYNSLVQDLRLQGKQYSLKT